MGNRELHYGLFGNGLTVYDVSRTDPRTNDYPIVAHISVEGNVKQYVDDLTIEEVKEIKETAQQERDKFIEEWNKLDAYVKYEKLLDNAPYSVYKELIDERSYNKVALGTFCDKFMPRVFFTDYTYFDNLSSENKEYMEKVIPQCIDRIELYVRNAKTDSEKEFFETHLAMQKHAIAGNLDISVQNLDYLVDEYRTFHTEDIQFIVRGTKNDLRDLRDELLRGGHSLHNESYSMSFTIKPEELNRYVEFLDGMNYSYQYEYQKREIDKIYKQENKGDTNGLEETVEEFFRTDKKVCEDKSGTWKIAAGGYDLVAEIYQDNIPVCGVTSLLGGGFAVEPYNDEESIVNVVSKAINKAFDYDECDCVRQSPLLDEAIACIQTYYDDEFGDDHGDVDEDNLSGIGLAYTTDEENEGLQIQVIADLIENKIVKTYGFSDNKDGEYINKYMVLSEERYDSLREMIDADLSCLGSLGYGFSELVSISDEDREKYYSKFPEERPDTLDLTQTSGRK